VKAVVIQHRYARSRPSERSPAPPGWGGISGGLSDAILGVSEVAWFPSDPLAADLQATTGG
jgi:hypothetical protein